MTHTTILVISGWSLRESHCQRAHVASLRRLARHGYRIHLMTFERRPYRGTRADERTWRAALLEEGIVWHPLAYHHRPLLPAKMWDGLRGVWAGWRLMRREPVGLLHARSEFPGVIASILGWLTRRPFLYEHDAPISEERVDVGVWRRGGLVYRVTRAWEKWLPQVAQEMIVLSQRYADRLRQQGARIPVTVLPCCTDVELFHRDPAERARMRQELGWSDRLVVVYSGSIGGWYQFDEMAEFVARLHAARPKTHWLCLVPADPVEVRRVAERRGVPSEALTVRSLHADDVPRWLAAGDIGLAFIRPGTSKFASSPNKLAEYLACGLPVIMTAGVGDTEQLLEQPEVGYVLKTLGPESYDRAMAWIERVAPRLEAVAHACRRIAMERLSVQHTALATYLAVYRRLTQSSWSVLPSESIGQMTAGMASRAQSTRRGNPGFPFRRSLRSLPPLPLCPWVRHGPHPADGLETAPQAGRHPY